MPIFGSNIVLYIFFTNNRVLLFNGNQHYDYQSRMAYIGSSVCTRASVLLLDSKAVFHGDAFALDISAIYDAPFAAALQLGATV